MLTIHTFEKPVKLSGVVSLNNLKVKSVSLYGMVASLVTLNVLNRD